jgi:hypothetical protein
MQDEDIDSVTLYEVQLEQGDMCVRYEIWTTESDAFDIAMDHFSELKPNNLPGRPHLGGMSSIGKCWLKDMVCPNRSIAHIGILRMP